MDIILQRVDVWLRQAMPSALAVLMTLLSVIVWPLPYLGPVMPPLAFIALYYWSAHRPDLFPVGVAFAIGLLNDIINDLPLGVSALLFTVAHQLIVQQQRLFTGHSFITLWAGFALTATVMMIAQWIVVDIVKLQLIPFLPIFTQTLLVVLLFPLPCWILIQLQRVTLTPG